MIGTIREITDAEVIVHPLVLGAPRLQHPLNENIPFDFSWHGFDWFQLFPGDIDEFEQMNTVPDSFPDEWMSVMKRLSQKSVKEAFCTILGEVPRKDWGGELDDVFTAHLHVSGQRVAAAFLLKGPASFSEMTPDMLGKRAGQIYRLSQAPAGLLFVQHCHAVGEAVRATLKAFAVVPHAPRRYCIIDGRDTHRILRAYKLST